ncbi:AAA family ATPase [Spirosoma luteolum]
MGQSLKEIAQSLKNADKKIKVQLIYAFNGSGKTRLSRAFKELVAPKNSEPAEEESKIKVMYYNAFTEDLFYWDNDLDNDTDRKLKIQPNSYTDWILKEQGQELNIAKHFQRYTNDKLTPNFNEEYRIKDKDSNDVIVPVYSEVRFSFERGNNEPSEFIKISKGEESCFVWSIFYSLLAQTISVLNVAEEVERETEQFNDLQYVFIDDPVSSLDDAHLIELAVNIAELIKSSQSDLKFIITTHNPLFYNVLFNEFNNTDARFSYKPKYCVKKRLEKLDDGTFQLHIQPKDSPFAYHLFLLAELEKVTESGDVKKYHFNFLRNILEKAATFLGYGNWEELLPNDAFGAREGYYKRIINFSSHSKFSAEEIPFEPERERTVLAHIISDFRTRHGFKLKESSTVNQ